MEDFTDVLLRNAEDLDQDGEGMARMVVAHSNRTIVGDEAFSLALPLTHC